MLFQVALRNVMRSTRRSASILATVLFGVLFLGMFHAFNGGLLDSVKASTIHARYGHGQINTVGYRERVFDHPWEHWMGELEPLRQALAKAGVRAELFPRVTFSALLTNDKTTIAATGQGVDAAAEASFFHLLNVVEGQTLRGEPKGVLLGQGLAKSLGRKVGDRVTVLTNDVNGSLDGVDLVVVGIFHTGSPELDENVFRMQLSTAQTLLGTQRVETIAVGLADESDWPRLAAVVSQQFPTLESAPFNVVDKVNYQQFVDWLKSQFGVIETIILTLVLLGILNIVSTGVLERKQEFGVMKANGDTAADVLAMITLEAVIVGVLGVLAGAALILLVVHGVLRNGFAMPPTPGITTAARMYLAIAPRKLLETCALPLVVTILAALLAGLRVARLPIAEGLRSS